MVLKTFKMSQRFPDLETAYGFAEENHIKYDEVILLFNHSEEVAEEKPELKAISTENADKDKIIQDLLMERNELRKAIPPKEVIPPLPEKPITEITPKPIKKGLFGKKKVINPNEQIIRELR